MSEIVTATAAMTAHMQLGESPETVERDARVKFAMVAAIGQCMAAGVTDPEAIRHAQLAARDKVLAQ